jgi:hypothetical protein
MANSEFSVIGLAHKFLLAGERVGYTASTFNGMAEKPGLLSDFLAVYDGRSHIVPIEVAPVTPTARAARNTITVLPSLTILERIALGKYDGKNGEISNVLFPHDVMTVGEYEFDFYNPFLFISSEDAKTGAEVDGWTVAKAEHLLAVGQAFPEVQRETPIVALGSVCGVGSNRQVLTLRGEGRRGVFLYDWCSPWAGGFRFLRVRKVLAV